MVFVLWLHPVLKGKVTSLVCPISGGNGCLALTGLTLGRGFAETGLLTWLIMLSGLLNGVALSGLMGFSKVRCYSLNFIIEGLDFKISVFRLTPTLIVADFGLGGFSLSTGL